MQNIFLIHGSYGSPEENWFPWIKDELEKLDYKVQAPKFPTPEGQSLETWLKAFEPYREYLTEETIFVAHSLGPAFCLAVIETLDHPIKACFFVAGFIDFLNNPDFDKINRSFVQRDFDWAKIKENCKNFTVFHSDNDPYVPLEQGRALARELGTDLILVPGAGHFNEAAGYTEFRELRDRIVDF